MSKRTNPMSVIISLILIIVSLVVAFVVKGALPASVSNWSGLIFWLIIIVVGGGGTFACAYFMNGKRR